MAFNVGFKIFYVCSSCYSYMFFNQISRNTSTSLFFILFSFLQWNLHALVYIQPKYIQNQEVYYFEKSIYNQLNAFSTKKIVSSKLKYYEWCFHTLILTGWHLKNVILF